MDMIKNSVVFFTLFHINGVLSAISSATFSVNEGTIPNLAGTVGLTVRNGSVIEMRCIYDAVPTTDEIGANEFHLNAEVQPSSSFFRYVHKPTNGEQNPEITGPFLTPMRLARKDGENFDGIQVDPILLTDENTYKCVVVLANFQSLSSPTVKVNVVAVPHVPTLSRNPEALVAGNKLTLTCSTNVGKPKGQLKWLRQLKTESPPVVIQRSNTVSENKNSDGSYDVTESYIVDILLETYDGAKFICESRNDAMLSTEGSRKTELILDVKYPVRDIKVTPIEQPHYPGHQFKCEAVGNPAPAYKWTKVNGTQTLSNSTSGNILIIPDTATPESLFYTCTASNTPGSSEVQISYTLNVTITAPPTTPSTTTEVTTPTTTQQTPKPPGAAKEAVVDAGMIGGIVGALIAIIIIVIMVICICRNKKKKEVENVEKGEFKSEPNNSKNIPMGGFDVDVDDNFNPAEDPKKKNLEGLVYADLNFDDRPRSRKPIQIQEDFDRADYADIRRV